MAIPETGAVAVVTGATRGIGRQVALALADRAVSVVVVGRTGRAAPHATLPGTVEDVAAEIEARGVRALGVQADLTSADDTARIVEATLAEFGRCDVVVNNAAYTSNGPIMAVPSHRWERAFRVQVAAPLQLSHGFVPGMIERGAGSIVHVSSGVSTTFTAGLALYSVSKAAMERMSDYLALELADDPVAVNALRVDRIVATEGWQHVADTQGMDVATGGGHATSVMEPALSARHVMWMLDQPTSWSGNTVGFDDITVMGGPPTPPR